MSKRIPSRMPRSATVTSEIGQKEVSASMMAQPKP